MTEPCFRMSFRILTEADQVQLLLRSRIDGREEYERMRLGVIRRSAPGRDDNLKAFGGGARCLDTHWGPSL